MDLRKISFGTTSAVVSGMALVTGLDAVGGTRVSVVAGLLVFALADNVVDSLSVHVFQESERLDSRAAFAATVGNFGARLLVSLSFVLIVLLLPGPLVLPGSLAWGSAVLAIQTTLLARLRHVRTGPELVRHISLAIAAIAVSKLIGILVVRSLH